MSQAVTNAQAHKEACEAAYRAFSEGDAAAAMEDMADSVEWRARGDSALSGTYRGKGEIAELWAKLAEKGLKTEPHDFIADGDKVVVLTTVTLDGQSEEEADVLTYDQEGKLIAFESLGDPAIFDRAFPR
ncbi:MAG TPA: nuclear transport factor 2 family protein [Solirubrobacterales bacterium]|nr:nuclear transport factor 2 family protein [Solirubrobacterales bacterium]